jgi:hypothetical protein
MWLGQGSWNMRTARTGQPGQDRWIRTGHLRHLENISFAKIPDFCEKCTRKCFRERKFSLTFSRNFFYFRENVSENENFRKHFHENVWNINIFVKRHFAKFR